MQGLSLHAAVRCGANDGQALEQLCRHSTHPALANECVQTNAAEQVVLMLKTPWRDGTTHLVMSPLECMQLSIEWPVSLLVAIQLIQPARDLGVIVHRSPGRGAGAPCDASTAGFKEPKGVVFVDALPKSPSGKPAVSAGAGRPLRLRLTRSARRL